MKSVKYEERLFELSGCVLSELGIVDQSNQSANVVSAMHVAQQGDRAGSINERALTLAGGDRREKARLDVGCLVNARRHTLGYQFEQEFSFALGRCVQKLDKIGDLCR